MAEKKAVDFEKEGEKGFIEDFSIEDFKDPEFIALNLLWDFPNYVENPQKVVELFERIEKGELIGYDRILINTMKDRLELFPKDIVKPVLEILEKADE